MVEKFKKWDIAVEIPVDQIIPDPLNPNVMDDETFNQLVEMIQEYGFDEPLQVTLYDGNKEGEDTFYMIVGGEHRYRAAKVLGFEKIPCVVKDIPDDLERHTALVRRNLVHGELDKTRFNKLIKDIQDRHNNVDIALLGRNMGFKSEEEMARYIEQEKIEKEKKEKTAKKAAEESTNNDSTAIVNNVSYALNDIFSQYGDTIPMGYMFFAYKNKLHMIVQEDKALYELVRGLAEKLQRDNQSIVSYLKAVFLRASEDDDWPKVEDFAEGTTDYEPDSPSTDIEDPEA